MVDDYLNLVLYSGEEIYKTLFGRETRKILSQLYHNENNLFSFSSTYFIEKNGQLIAAMVCYPGKIKLKTLLNTGKIMLKNMRANTIRRISKFIQTASFGPIDSRDLYISNLAVHPEYRRRGYGTSLLKYAEKLAVRGGYKRLILDTRVDNNPAVSLYYKLKFKPIKVFKFSADDQTFYFVKMQKNIVHC